MYFHDCLYHLKFPEAMLPSKPLGGEEVRKEMSLMTLKRGRELLMANSVFSLILLKTDTVQIH